MGTTPTVTSLRVLAADEDEETLRSVDELLAKLGHTVTATSPSLPSTTTTSTRWSSSRRSTSTPRGRSSSCSASTRRIS